MTAAVVPGGLPLRLRTGAFTRAAASGEPCASTDPACQRATIIERAGLRRATPSTFASAWAWGLLRVAMHVPHQWGKARAHTTRQGSIVNAECGAAMIVRSEGGGWVGGGGTPIDVAGRAYTEAAEVAVSLQHRRLHLSAQCPHVVCVPKWHGSGSAGKSSSELMEAAASHLSGSGSGSGARPALSAHSFMAVYSQPIGDHRIRWFVRVIKGTSSRSWWQNSSRRNSFGSLRRSLCNNGPSGPSLWRVIS